MKHGFVKVAAVTPKIKVADPLYNAEQICIKIKESYEAGAKIIVFPELCITGYTCGDLLLHGLLLQEAKEQLAVIAENTKGRDALIFVGLPLEYENKLYNAAAAIHNGEVLAFIPKSNIPSYAEFYESRYFAEGHREPVMFQWFDGTVQKEVPFGTNLLFRTNAVEGLVIGCEICEDIWVPDAPSISHAMAGATVIVNLSASDETVGKDEYREMMLQATSAKLVAAYIYASAGEGESTQDMVFGGHNLIAENGTLLASGNLFDHAAVYAEIDVDRLRTERRRMNTYRNSGSAFYRTISFTMQPEETCLTRSFARMPFVPSDSKIRDKRCEEILSIQSYGLKQRMVHTGCRKAVVGISGGLDSALALLVAARTFDMLKLDRRDILAVTMPCFGTTDRTYDNACRMTKMLGATLEEVNIKEAVALHFRDIKQDMALHDVTYENSQARERTQVLMDIANREGGMVIGTGDMSELALGWATYNGDHMSMYGVNAGVPKTLVRHLVYYYADTCMDSALKETLMDILDTPVSPELLPPVEGMISQKTEDLVGPYELHDFFLYYMLRCSYDPDKIFRIAKISFADIYSEEIILKWLKTFYKRFFSQQFKRSCLPDGPKVGSVAISPRGDLRMPSDACAKLWLDRLDQWKAE